MSLSEWLRQVIWYIHVHFLLRAISTGKKVFKICVGRETKVNISALNLQVALAVCFCNVDFKYMYK